MLHTLPTRPSRRGTAALPLAARTLPGSGELPSPKLAKAVKVSCGQAGRQVGWGGCRRLRNRAKGMQGRLRCNGNQMPPSQAGGSSTAVADGAVATAKTRPCPTCRLLRLSTSGVPAAPGRGVRPLMLLPGVLPPLSALTPERRRTPAAGVGVASLPTDARRAYMPGEGQGAAAQ